MIDAICDNYASERGLVRLVLAHIEGAVGNIRGFQAVDMQRVERLVFICLGNICRSPFAEFVAQKHQVPTAGFGLATSTGSSAFPLGIETAKKFDVDLTTYRTTDFSDFELQDSDLLMVMETRHARRLKKMKGESNAQIALLGQWATPRRLHIHDPHMHSERYFTNCYRVIEDATESLVEDYLKSRSTP